MKPLQRISESVTGIVPELNKPDTVDPVEEVGIVFSDIFFLPIKIVMNAKI